MRLSRLNEEYRFSNGQRFESDYQGSEIVPVITSDEIGKLEYLFHTSKNPDLTTTGLLTRQELGLPDKWKTGTDTTYQNAVYLSVTPQPFYGAHVYQVPFQALDKKLLKADEDAPQHTVANISFDDWISSLMIMGTVRYEGSIPANMLKQLS